MNDAEVLAAALAAGWTREATLLYDEECCEGWEWTGPDGRTCTSLADEVPERVRLAVDVEYASERKAAAEKTNGFADFLERLLQKGTQE